MGFFDWLFGTPKPATPNVQSILPDIAKNEIMNGRLPHINPDKLFLKRGEICHYADKAMLEVTKTKKTINSRHVGHSVPGLLKGNRWNMGRTVSSIDEAVEVNEYKGILYITNKRIVFNSKGMGFDKQFQYLSAFNPYANGIELQYGATIYRLFVPDGNVVYRVIQMLQ
ncbi:hypothetical protein [Butyrivibrio sp. AE3004]|uniref:hypothetical protein n=1 Tax=Butyrivibrio sp. AE3004 TaxID=1506994 RepID=UPI0004940D39|nr:hypothetical protein [Butyrivibrio sp. AE3004]